MKCGAVCCSALQCVADCCSELESTERLDVCCSMLQYVAVWCSELQLCAMQWVAIVGNPQKWFFLTEMHTLRAAFYMCVCIHTHMYVCVYVYIYTYIYIYMYTFIYMYAYIYTHIYSTHVGPHNMYIYMCIHILYIHAHTQGRTLRLFFDPKKRSFLTKYKNTAQHVCV